jgi:hypothetical protein
MIEATFRNFKFGPAAPVHPNATFIAAPGFAFPAWRAADLPDQSDTAARVGLAINAPSVIGSTGDGAGVTAPAAAEATAQPVGMPVAARNPPKDKPLVRVAVDM